MLLGGRMVKWEVVRHHGIPVGFVIPLLSAAEIVAHLHCEVRVFCKGHPPGLGQASKSPTSSTSPR